MVEELNKLQLVYSARYKELVKSGDVDQCGMLKDCTDTNIKAIADEEDTFQFTISSDAVDRDQDTIDQKKWNLKPFKQVPTVLYAHDHRALPIGSARKIFVEDGKLKSVVKFTSHDENPMGHSVSRMVKAKHLRAASVGFSINPGAWKASEDPARPNGWDIKGQELHEWSVVPVGSNRDAVMGAKAAGIDVAPFVPWCRQLLDTWSGQKGIWLPRADVEEMYKFCKGNGFSILMPNLEDLTPLKKDSEMEDEKKKSILDSPEILEAIADDIKNQGQIGASIAVARSQQEAAGQEKINKSILATLGTLTETLKSIQESLKPTDPHQESAKAEEGSEDKGAGDDAFWSDVLEGSQGEEKTNSLNDELQAMIQGSAQKKLNEAMTPTTGLVF